MNRGYSFVCEMIKINENHYEEKISPISHIILPEKADIEFLETNEFKDNYIVLYDHNNEIIFQGFYKELHLSFKQLSNRESEDYNWKDEITYQVKKDLCLLL